MLGPQFRRGEVVMNVASSTRSDRRSRGEGKRWDLKQMEMNVISGCVENLVIQLLTRRA